MVLGSGVLPAACCLARALHTAAFLGWLIGGLVFFFVNMGRAKGWGRSATRGRWSSTAEQSKAGQWGWRMGVPYARRMRERGSEWERGAALERRVSGGGWAECMVKVAWARRRFVV